jgi:hypothetical protein
MTVQRVLFADSGSIIMGIGQGGDGVEAESVTGSWTGEFR